MSKPFKIIVFVIFYFLYLITLSGIIVGQWQKYEFFKNKVSGPIISLVLLLLPFLVILLIRYLRRKWQV